MANTALATLQALNPDHYWQLDESSGSFVDSGDVGGFDFSTVDADTYREGPGIPNGLPAVNAMWGGGFEQSTPNIYNGSTSWAVGTSTIVIGAWIRLLADNSAGIILGDNLNNAGIWSGLWIDDNRALLMTSRGNSDSVKIEAKSADGAIAVGVAYFVCGVQRGDGNGLRIYINGVDVTDTQSNVGVTVDAWDNETKNGAWTPTRIGIRNQRSYASGTPPGAYQVSLPFLFIDSVISDAQILSLATAGNISGSFQDYADAVFATIGNFETEVYYWFLMARTTTAGTDPLGTPRNKLMNVAFPVARYAEDTDIVSPFNYEKAVYAATSDTMADGSGTNLIDVDTPSVGTINVIVKVITALNGTSYLVFSWGSGGVGGQNVDVGVDGSALGYSIFIDIYTGGGTNRYQLREVARFFPGTDVHMFTFVQDGTALKMYIDGELENPTPTQAGVFDATSWFDDVEPSTTNPVTRWGGVAGSATVEPWTPNELIDTFVTEKALSADEVKAIWDAYNGTFPTINTLAPPAGFFNTIITTGNAGNPDGTGPDHYWRMNADSVSIVDIGVATINGDSIALGGDPQFNVQGPLINDPSNRAIFFDGQGDYIEVGDDGVSGDLIDASTGTFGFFISGTDLTRENIVYSQSNDLATEFVTIGMNASAQLEFFLQTSSGNSVRFTSSITIENLDFVFAVLTNDGTDYRWYVAGVEDGSAVLATEGTGAEGQWFDDVPNGTRSAVGARADSSFNTQARARFSEIFVYNDEVLNAAQIGALFNAAQADGAGTVSTPLGSIVFEDCVFQDGGLADIRLQNGLTDFTQVLEVNRCRFFGGAQGADRQSIRLQGLVNAQVRGSVFSMGNETITTGRAAIVGTAADSTAVATLRGSLLATDCEFIGMGRTDEAAVYLASAFGATVEDSRFTDSVVAGVAWRGDAEGMSVARSQFNGLQSGVAAIRVLVGLNTNIGNSWMIAGNTIIGGVAGIQIEGDASNGNRARFVNVLRNEISGHSAVGISLDDIQDFRASGNRINGGTEGIRIGDMATIASIRGNTIEGHADEAIIFAEASVSGFLAVEENLIVGNLSNEGILINGIANALIRGNHLTNVINGLQLGAISASVQVFDNTMLTTTTPIFLIAATTRANFEIGKNEINSLGADLDELTVAATAIEVVGPYHQITVSGASDLDNIGGALRDGSLVGLQVAAGSDDITPTEAGDMTLNDAPSPATLSAGDTIWLIKDGSEWYELSRSDNAL